MGKLTALVVVVATAAASLTATTALAGPTVGDTSGLPRPAGTASGATTGTPPTFEPSGLREPAPRPTAEVRVQNRFAHNAGTLQLFGGVDYLERRDFYLSPGVRVGATYFPWESFGLEVQNLALLQPAQSSRRRGGADERRHPRQPRTDLAGPRRWPLLDGLRQDDHQRTQQPRDPFPAASAPAGRDARARR